MTAIRSGALLLLALVLALIAACSAHGGSGDGAGEASATATGTRTVAAAVATATSPDEPAATAAPRSDTVRLRLRTTLGGDISPKSVAASGTGLVFAQNMMYRHTVTVYDARKIRLRKTIPDTVRLSRLGYPQYPGTQQGAPVEAAFSPDQKYAYVSNYSMYGAN